MIRQSQFDVTNTVDVSNHNAVSDTVCAMLRELYPNCSTGRIEQGFQDLADLYMGKMPGFLPADMPYHDLQHCLDVTLAMARLLYGYETNAAIKAPFGFDILQLGIITALFHDSGYICRTEDECQRGAEYTRIHVSRSAQFLSSYLANNGMGEWVDMAKEIVHFTGYEMKVADIQVASLAFFKLGSMLGTADLIAQMADRCYLEKCRDRLYEEFVLAGIASRGEGGDNSQAVYHSATELLVKTPAFIRSIFDKRLSYEFGNVYHYAMYCFDDRRNPYLEEIEKSVSYLEMLVQRQDFSSLRRKPLWTLSFSEEEICPYRQL